MAHYTVEELEMYRHGEMSVLGRVACAAHLKTCKKCATLLKKLESDDQFLKNLRVSVKTYAQLVSRAQSSSNL